MYEIAIDYVDLADNKPYRALHRKPTLDEAMKLAETARAGIREHADVFGIEIRQRNELPVQVPGFRVDNDASDETHLYVDVAGVGTVCITLADEGVVVDVYPLHVVDCAIASCWATYAELSAETPSKTGLTLTALVEAVTDVLPDLERFCSKQGYGPDIRMNHLRRLLGEKPIWREEHREFAEADGHL